MNTLITKFVKFLGMIGMLAVLALMAIMTLDVILRYVFNRPLLSAYVLTEYLMVIFTYSAIAYAELREDHVSVTLLFSKFSVSTQAVLNICNRLIMLLFTILIAKQALMRTIDSIQVGRTAIGPVAIPQAPAESSVFIGCIALCLLLIVKIYGYGLDFYNSIFNSQQDR
jgi:TRAP-type C4-dicarboxylate transport system permease small subunit